MGGKKHDGLRTNTMELFEPRSGEIKLLEQTLPKARSGFAAISIGSKIIIIGGNDGHVLKSVDILDTVTM